MSVNRSITIADTCNCCGGTPTATFNCESTGGRIRVTGQPPFDDPDGRKWFRYVYGQSEEWINTEIERFDPYCNRLVVRRSDSIDTSFTRWRYNDSLSSAPNKLAFRNESRSCGGLGAGFSQSAFIPSSWYSAPGLSESLSEDLAGYSTSIPGDVECGDLGDTDCTSGGASGPISGGSASSVSFRGVEQITLEEAMTSAQYGTTNLNYIRETGPTEGTQCYGIVSTLTVLSTDAKWGDYSVRANGTSVKYTVECAGLVEGSVYEVTVTYERCTIPASDPGGDWVERGNNIEIITDVTEVPGTALGTFSFEDHVPIVEDYYTGITGVAIQEKA